MSASAPAKPKSYLLTSAVTPLGQALTQHLLSRGACVAACLPRLDLAPPLPTTPPGTLITPHLDPALASTAQSALATAIAVFGRLDAVVHTGVPTVVGALEELSAAEIATQLETGYFGRLRVVRAAVAALRRQRGGGHIVVVTGLTAVLGTPALSVRSAADHAISGLLEALAFEVAPFGVRVSVVQPPVEAAMWGSGQVVMAGRRDEYAGGSVGSMRAIAEGIVNGGVGLEDTVRIVAAIAGTEDPPTQITVGAEAVEAVREKLKAMSEELEEFLDASLAADGPAGQGGREGCGEGVGE